MKRLTFLAALVITSVALTGCRSGGWFNRGAPCAVCGQGAVCDSCQSDVIMGEPVLGPPTVFPGTTPLPNLLPGPN